jgi:hypothetical protein
MAILLSLRQSAAKPGADHPQQAAKSSGRAFVSDAAKVDISIDKTNECF